MLSGGCWLDAGDVVKLLVEVLLCEEQCRLFANEFTSTVVKFILSNRLTWNQLDLKLCLSKIC